MQEYVAARDDRHCTFFLQGICDACQRMERLIEAMLVLARVSRSEPRLEEVDLAELAREVAAELRLARLERHRDHHFRRIPSRRVSGEKTALRFIEEVGFCCAFTAGLDVPCLREAIAGRREPALPEHIQHDYAIGLTWELKDSLAAKLLAYYGKVIAGRPGFLARDLVGAFLRLRMPPGGYLKLYQRGMLSHCAKLVMDALTRRGAAETRALKLASGYAQPRNRAAFDRAMKELQEKFLALKVEERYEPFTYVWDTVEHRWADAVRAARAT